MRIACLPVASMLVSAASFCQTDRAPLGPPQWRAHWVWGAENMNGGPGYFRIAFEVKPGLKSALWQGVGDDSFVQYVNGQEILRGGFGFGRSYRHDVTKLLRPGKNVLAAVCHNAAYPGGWLSQLTLVYEDGTEEEILSDRNTRFWHEEQEGWNQLGFDDSGWEKCREIARPPGGIWGPLPVEYAGRRQRVKLLELRARKRLELPAKLRVKATLAAAEPLTWDVAGYIAVKRGDRDVARMQFTPEPPVNTWKPGEPHVLGPFELPISRYVSSGEAEIEFGLYRTTFEEEGDTVTRSLTIKGREGKARPTPASIKPYRGAPCLFIGRKPFFPLLYLQGRQPVPEQYGHMVERGYQVFSCTLSLGWVGPDKYDYAETDATMIALLTGAESGYVIPRVSVSAPGWWCSAHEDELARYADGTGWVSDGWGGTKHQSFASEVWRRDAGEALRRLIRHIQASPYADRVIGYHVCSGIYGEWHLWSPSHLPDTSEPLRRRFIRWCREKYGTIERLNAAWGTDLSGFDDITCPTKEERYAGDLGVFRDLSKSTRVPDYWRCLHETTADAIGYFCRIVKEETRGKALAGAFYCYITDIGWAQEGGHLAVARALADPNIDFIANPHSYDRRGLGQDGACRNYPASVALHGKLFIDEGDDRTYLVNDAWTHVKTADETIQILRRAALNAVAARHGMWWFDMTTGWYEDPRLLETLGQLKAMADRTLDRARPRPTEVAVVCDPESFYVMRDWQTGQDHITPVLFKSGFADLFTMGAPFDVITLDDLMRLDLPDYRCYIFLNTYHMEDAERAELAARLQRDGKCLVFTYCPAISSDSGLAVEHAEELTGLGLTLRAKPGSVRVASTAEGARWMGVEGDFAWGPEQQQAPSLVVGDDGAIVLGRYTDDNAPAAAFKDQGDWSVLFSGTGPLPRELLRPALRQAGVHLYIDTPDNLYVGANLIGLHTTGAGEKIIRLPGEHAVRDALTGEMIADRTRRIEATLDAKVTAIWELLPPR